MGEFLCSLLGFHIFGVRAVFRVHDCHLFPQHMLAVSPLLGGVTGAVVPIAYTGCGAGASSALWL